MQKFIVILIVVASTAYLVWKFYKKFYKKEEGCDKCGLNSSATKMKK